MSTEVEIHRWFKGGDKNLFVVTGSVSGVAVLDVDSKEAEEYWIGQGVDLDGTTSSTTGKGKHFWFTIATGQEVRSWGNHEDPIHFDLRAEGTGVIVPPSVHETGRRYRWVRDLDHIQPLPDVLISAEGISDSGISSGSSGEGARRSQLSALIQAPAEKGGRNDWLTRVAGHYAKLFRDKEDAYVVHVRLAAGLLSESLPESEVSKMLKSVWQSEHSTHPPADAGGLIGDGKRLYSIVKGGGREIFAYFDVEAVGFAADVGYQVNLDDGNGHRVSRLLDGNTLANLNKLNAALYVAGGYSLGPAAVKTAQGRATDRLVRYLESQHPPLLEPYHWLDWSEALGGYVTADGLVRPNGGAAETQPVIVRPRDPGWSYAFEGGPEDATAVLREVLTWHDDTVVAVFGSWWAACLVKFWIAPITSQFPVMGIQASSESGKTTGFFRAMMELNGRMDPGDFTSAALRDALASNRIGIVWVDDTNRPENLHALIRQVTVEGTMHKKSTDFTQDSIRLVGPMVVSGETTGLSGEKALIDRMILLDVPSPKERKMSDGRYQWDRIVEFRLQHPRLANYSGWLLSRALTCRRDVLDLPSRREGSGREEDKWAILRTGASVLEKLSGLDVSDTLESWIVEAKRNAPMGNENKLTLEHLPRALMYTGLINSPRAAVDRDPPTPAFVQEGIIWFHPGYLAEWIKRREGYRLDPRVDSEEAIRQQAHALDIQGLRDGKMFRLSASKLYARYWGISGEVAARVLERSTGVSEGADNGADTEHLPMSKGRHTDTRLTQR
jgi:hypothetical protein